MKELALFGVKYLAVGKRDARLIRWQKCRNDWEQAVELCDNLPIDRYDCFLLIDESTGGWYEYDLGKPLRRKRRIDHQRLFEGSLN